MKLTNGSTTHRGNAVGFFLPALLAVKEICIRVNTYAVSFCTSADAHKIPNQHFLSVAFGKKKPAGVAG
jgi:hypothetical protein